MWLVKVIGLAQWPRFLPQRTPRTRKNYQKSSVTSASSVVKRRFLPRGQTHGLSAAVLGGYAFLGVTAILSLWLVIKALGY